MTHVHSLDWVIFQWLILSLCSYRLQRIVTADSWPPSRWFRVYLRRRFGEDSSITDFFHCPWCFGFWLTIALGALHNIFVGELLTGKLHHPALFLGELIVAATAIVGQIGQRDE